MGKQTVTYEDFVVPALKGANGETSSNPIEEVEVALARARGVAHADGFEAGKKTAEAAFDRSLAAKLHAIEKALIDAQDMMESSEKSAH